MRAYTAVWLTAVLGVAIAAPAAKEYTPPNVNPAKTYPANDYHPNEPVAVAADPYDTSPKASTVFSQPYLEKDYLPILLAISNEDGQTISLAKMSIELVTGNRAKISPASRDDLYRRFARIKRRGDEPSRLPVPLPRRGPDVGLSKQAALEFDQAPFKAQAVEPHMTQAGFLFFDVGGIDHPLRGSHLYITGVRDGNGNELLFFDIPLDKYLNQPK